MKTGFLPTILFLLQKVYEGTVGDRRVILRENGGGIDDQLPTIEIFSQKETDKVFYMGKGWNKYGP